MISFLAALAVLISGYLLYGKVLVRIFKPDDRAVPAKVLADGVDYVEMPAWRAFMVQLLNIAGVGPIFGAISGALWGPSVFIWIALGSVLAGGVHDYLSGMISLRHKGASISEIVGRYMGKGMKNVMRVFSVILLILVGTVFVTSPAALLAKLTPGPLNTLFWTIIILIYYLLATMLPIDKLIGRIYPVFGAALLIMAVGITGGLIFGGYKIPEISLQNLHPSGTAIWPMMFVTVACGAISGFHSTQSPIIARCLKHEKYGRPVFYGAMISEGVIALIWAAVGCAFYGSTGGLSAALAKFGGQSGVVYDIATGLLGTFGGALALLGVVACPITSGDTAFRSARLTLADWFNVPQEKLRIRLIFSLPLLGLGAVLTQVDFNIIWRYFAWSNQTLAMIVLWTCAVFLVTYCKNKFYSLIAALPAAFMSAVSLTYILMAKEGFQLSSAISYPAGIVFALLLLGLFVWRCFFSKKALAPKIDGGIQA